MNILITGATGSLGTVLVDICLHRGYHPIGIGHSEKRTKELELKYPQIPIYAIDIYNRDDLDKIVNKHSIDYIVHTAAMKHIGICEKNPTRAVDVNINGSRNIIDIAYSHKVQNVIAVSTDKAINPSCVYGSTKLIMEKLMLENDYSVIQGVNFFFSSGSVLDIWQKCKDRSEPIKININNTVRYFVDVKDVAVKILDNLDTRGKYIHLDTCYRIHLHDLAKGFCEYHNYDHTDDYHPISAEKTIEEIPEEIHVRNIGVSDIKLMLEKYYGH